MAGKQNSNRPNKSATGTTALVATIATAAIGIIPAVMDKLDQISTKREESKSFAIVPQLYKKGFPLELDQATEILANANLKAIPSKLNIKEAHPRYKDCFDMQVISADPKPEQKVEVGSSVVVRYITQEVIEESQRLFDEEEERKAAQREQRKAAMDNAAKKVKQGVTGILPKRKKTGKAEQEQA